MTDPQDLAALVAKLRAPAYWMSGSSEGHEGENDLPREAADALEAQAAEIARLTHLFDLSQKTTEAVLDRAEKAEAEVEERHQLHLEQVRITNEWIERYDKAEAALSESRAAEEGAMMILTQTIAERDAARKALTESQALLAQIVENAVWQIRGAVPGHMLACDTERICEAVRDLTPADAQAALEARDKAKVEEGYLIAMAEAKKLGAYIVAPEHCPAILAKIKEAEK